MNHERSSNFNSSFADSTPQPEELMRETFDDTHLYSVLSDIIRRNKGDATEVISIVGGAGSGKTTLAKHLCESLGNADTIGTDDYVVGDRAYRRANLEGGDPIQKYNPAKLNEHIQAIKNLQEGEEIGVPTYNERTGEGVDASHYAHRVGKVDYLIVEGDFDFVEHPDLLVYFDVPDEARLENRISRDLQTRNVTSVGEIEHSFALRQELQHLPYTLPTRDKADLVVHVQPTNSGDYLYDIVDRRN